MSWHHIVGAVLTVFFLAAIWFVHRLSRRIARRCCRSGCGRIRQRTYKILLALGESVSWRSAKGKIRWYIRRVVKLTFARCEEHGYELVKFDTDPISLWHAFWVKWFHREQYVDDPTLIVAVRDKMRQLYPGARQTDQTRELTDTPPLRLLDLFGSYFDGLSKALGEEEEEGD